MKVENLTKLEWATIEIAKTLLEKMETQELKNSSEVMSLLRVSSMIAEDALTIVKNLESQKEQQ